MKYGELPKELGVYEIACKEMFFYQYLPIKLIGDSKPITEDRLRCFDKIIGAICCDFIGEFGLNRYINSYVYLTAKNMFVTKGCSYNRPGYHSDGFMTDDINYIWCDVLPTVFNTSQYALTMHHEFSLTEMEQQSLKENEITYQPNALLRLNQFSIHKVADVDKTIQRAFLKISFSEDKYDLEGNSHNYLLKYDWEMNKRNVTRNIPQSIKQ